jgi:hypothetical protein
MEQTEEEALRELAAEIRRFRQEWADSIRQQIEADAAAMETKDYDPARGRGRGPKWVEGA